MLARLRQEHERLPNLCSLFVFLFKFLFKGLFVFLPEVLFKFRSEFPSCSPSRPLRLAS